MSWSYTYSPDLLTIVVPVLFLISLGCHGFRHRSVPGALSFSILMMLSVLWLMSDALRLSSLDGGMRIFWYKWEVVLMLPMATASFCFVTSYAGLSKWLTRWTIASLTLVPLAFAIMVLTDGIHHWVWKRIFFDGAVHADVGPVHWIAYVYGWCLSVLQLAILIWLFMRSPRHRWIAAGLIVTLFLMRAAVFFNISGINPFQPLNPLALALNVALLPYAFAFFGLRLFDVVPVARHMIMDQMSAAVIVLDGEKRIADFNEPAGRLFGLSRKKAIGRKAESALQSFPALLAMIRNSAPQNQEISLFNPHPRCYQLFHTPLRDQRGFPLGELIWIQDITEQKEIQNRMLEYQRTHAMLQERELLARELHDGIGQILAAAQLQIFSAKELLARGEANQAELYLQRLSGAVQEAKESIRCYLAGVKASAPEEKNFLEMLQTYLLQFSRNHDIRTELSISPDAPDLPIDSVLASQLLPIIQEALTNARRHGKAAVAKVLLDAGSHQLRVSIQDDGQGFDTGAGSRDHGFGLRSMQGRAESAGGHFEVRSIPGKGTRVTVMVPWRKEKA